MKIDCRLVPAFADAKELRGKTAVVIDVLRATTTIITALNNGARQVIPVATVAEAWPLYNELKEHSPVLLAGERDTKIIPGFHLGNSPFEFQRETVADKTIILTTTNGAQSLVRVAEADEILIAAFLNARTVAQTLVRNGRDIEIVCSGSEMHFSLEDTLCAGYIVHEILALFPEAELSDSVRMALLLLKEYGPDMQKAVSRCEHATVLIANDFSADVVYCGMTNIFHNVPVSRQNSITLNNNNNNNY
jgi:2-phosphosulfolactate phosphatase